MTYKGADEDSTQPVPVSWSFLQNERDSGIIGETKHVYGKWKKRFLKQRATYSFLDWLQMILPCVKWIREYKIREYLLWDLIAGLSVGAMLVPQGMGYATTAGLPIVYGLYGGFLPCMVYGVFGSSKQLAVGPVAVTSLLISTKLQDLVPGSSSITANAPTTTTGTMIAYGYPTSYSQATVQMIYNTKAVRLAFIVSMLYTGLGVFRLGFITNFLSHAVIGGFMSGAAITIGLSQYQYVVGFKNSPPYTRINLYAGTYINSVHDLQWQEFIMGTTLIFYLIFVREICKRVQSLKWFSPFGPLTACIMGLISTYGGSVDLHGIRTIGFIPPGLPQPTTSWWFDGVAQMNDFNDLILIAVIVCLVDLLESTSIARALALKNKYELNFNLEVTGLGFANFAGACFNAYTTTGSFSRSSVNDAAGAKTPFSQFVCAWLIGFVLIFLTPVFANLPYNVLGAIVVVAVSTLFDYEQAIYLFRHSSLDFICWLASFLGVLFVSVEIGIAIAIGTSLVLIFYRSAFPKAQIWGHVPGTHVYQEVKSNPHAQHIPGLMIFHVDAPLYFANTQSLKDELLRQRTKLIRWSASQGARLEYIIFDLSGVNFIDNNGSSALLKLIDILSADGVQLALSAPNSQVVRQLEEAHVPDVLGREWVFVNVHDAVLYSQSQQAEKGAISKVQDIDY